jgi:predicted transcriptional regulator/transcriptional regulator with XRE-family HTH domain
MSRPLIGRTVRRLRQEKGISQQALAARLGISASYLNLIEHDQRSVTAALLIKLGETLEVDLGVLSGVQERDREGRLREALTDPLLGAEAVSEADIAALAAIPQASQAVLTLYRALRVAREDASGIALPSGRRIMLPNEEARDVFHERNNHFPALEAAAEALSDAMSSEGSSLAPAERNHAIAERLRQRHGLVVRVAPLQGALRSYDPEARLLILSEQLPRESRGFHLAFQLMLLEARDTVETAVAQIAPSSPEAAGLIRIGLLNYSAGCLLMPYRPYLAAAQALRHDVDVLAARFCVSFEQACHRLSTLQRPSERGIPFFFLRTDPAGNITKRFSAAGFPFLQHGGSCARWVPHTAFTTPGAMRVQVAQLPDGATFLCFARTVAGPATGWGDPPPIRAVTLGCDVSHATELVYADGLDVARGVTGIGLACRLCERADCRSRAFPPLEHRLALDPYMKGNSPYRFEPRPRP